MGTEIERKFLVRNDAWRQGAQGTAYRQGYLCNEPTHSVRVRLAGDIARLTVKGGNQGIARAEFEYEIPFEDARQLLENFTVGPLIEKVRYRVEHSGHVWEIDEFLGDNAGLIVAEVEIAAVNETVDLPAWVGQEVSETGRYFNASLSRYPYSQWSEEERSGEPGDEAAR